MPQLSKSQVSLVISGEDLAPNEITELLGCEPTKASAQSKGLAASTAGDERTTSHGHWRLYDGINEPADLDAHIASLAGRLTADLSVWDNLASRFDIQLFASLTMLEWNEGCEISSEALRTLSDRHIGLGLDIYAHLDTD
ncbi:MAG: DUF4279 domain-containing protein [Pseudomonadota bacterium]